MWEYRRMESQGRALTDFLSQTAERCMQDWAPGETCPAMYISLDLTSQCGVDKIREHLERAKHLLLLPSHTQALPLPSVLLNCDSKKKSVEKTCKWVCAFQNDYAGGEKCVWIWMLGFKSRLVVERLGWWASAAGAMPAVGSAVSSCSSRVRPHSQSLPPSPGRRNPVVSWLLLGQS